MNKHEQYLAHSKETINDKVFEAQSYQDHVTGVYNNALNSLNRIEKFITPDIFSILKKTVLIAATYHDLGKLDGKSQLILSGKSNDKMLNHVDAGIAHLLSQYEKTKDTCYLISSYLILSHHIGLPNYYKAFNQERHLLRYIISPKKEIRDHHIMSKYNMGRKMVKTHVNKHLKKYITIHNKICNLPELKIKTTKNNAISFLTNPLLLKIAISILVDADHEDTAKNYGDTTPRKMKKLNPENKIKNLFAYVEQLKNNTFNITPNAIERFNLRQEFLKCCCNTNLDNNFFLVDGTVGIGKTLGTMCLSLRLAMKYKLDNLIFVLPYISLIDQSTEQYQKSLFGTNQTTDYELGVIHSMWKNKNSFHRKYQKGFNAPVNLTTSIHFFDILVSNHTSIFKHLHKFIGSAICFDEYHTLHPDFWGIALKMMNGLSQDFSCRFIFSSGTPTRFWDVDEIKNLAPEEINPQKVINSDVYEKMIKMEENRVLTSHSAKQEWTFNNLANELLTKTESTFVILNTRKKAFGFLNILENKTNRKIFLRYSGMAPIDRQTQFNKIKTALSNNEAIILIATQGSEVGLDLSFRYGFKELSDFDSTIQMSGRMNRHYEYDNSSLHIFKLSEKANNDNNDDTVYGNNPQNIYRIKTIEQNLNLLNNISQKYCTYIAEEEIASESTNYMTKIAHLWDNKRFEDLDNDFSIISLPTISVLVNANIYSKILKNEYVPYSDLQNNIVNLIHSEKQMEILKTHLEKIEKEEEIEKEEQERKQKFSNLYYWKGEYDPERYGIFFDPVFGIMDKTKIIKNI